MVLVVNKSFDPTIASLLLALVCATSGWVVWWYNKWQFDKQIATQRAAEAATKAYAAERDFNHLRNNQIQISEGISKGFDEIERRLHDQDRELAEIKAWLIQRNQTDKH